MWLSGCATGASDEGGLRACLPVVEYNRAGLAREAEDVVLLLVGRQSRRCLPIAP
jgi:hypothetical protein